MESFFSNLPSPMELILDPVSLVVFAMYGILMAWEALFPARPLPKMKYWKLRGMTSFALFFFL